MSTPTPLLAHLAIKPDDKTITVIEHELADANFIITHLLKQFLSESKKVCFVIWHNSLGHYQNVMKRLGVDLLKKLEDGEVVVVQGLKRLLDEIVNDGDVAALRETIAEVFFEEVKKSVGGFVKNNENVYLIVDDYSHLFDLGVGLREVLGFVNKCVNLGNDERVCVVLGTHVSDKSDKIVANSLTYASDVTIVVSTLKTGRSRDVTGVIDVVRNRVDRVDTFHYQATEKEIRSFCPGQSLNFLYK